MNIRKSPEDRNVLILSKLDDIILVIAEITSDAEEVGFNSSRLSELQVALHEAISNAVKHGNKFDENKKVTVEWKQEGSGLRISVKDEGNGFNPEEVPNPLAPENLMKDSGRGLHFIKQLARETHFNKEGNCISFLFIQ